MSSILKKWNEKIIYQIFPRSFYDSNNDGDGDLKGIIKKLDYLEELGINAIWLCPIYDTEFKDSGYDVLDYKKVWKNFGTLADFKKLVVEAKKRNIEVIMDIVLNHTSTKHKWFLKAIESEKNPEHDLYIWTKEPKNEQSIFGGSAWEYIECVDKYYFHLFSKEQADLNWNSKQTIRSMADVINFWYKLGVRGFRLDAIQHVHKEFKNDHVIDSFGSKMVNYLQNFLNLVTKEKKDIFFIGEASGINPEKVLLYAKGKNKIADNFFNFSNWYVGWSKQTGRNGYDKKWDLNELINDQVLEYQNNDLIKNLMITNFLSSHDTARAISRWADTENYWQEAAKAFAMFQFMQKGLISILYGEEIGMINTKFNLRTEFRDVDAFNAFEILVDKNKIYSEKEMIDYHNINSRDHSRVPMIWNNSINYGFNKGNKTWIKLADRKVKNSVEDQLKDENSILNFYKILIKHRNKYKNILIYGKTNLQWNETREYLILKRHNKQKTVIALINLSNKEVNLNLNEQNRWKLLLSNYNQKGENTNILRAYEAKMFIFKND
ncbi:alpha-amylase family glycosyl hydrolase [[Mycoplasma] collis]|uniref:alpha-amylase family glycosyl hydrolase n=1 Tax=[Mycoplasma] collis TaxID=2127 RepID=UPI00051C8474|nr:alpha-amylase family glycosyl hydrolase [[Mycoplasma] collis]